MPRLLPCLLTLVAVPSPRADAVVVTRAMTAATIAEVHVEAHEVRTEIECRAGEPVELTAREFDLLVFFARNPGVVFRRMQLLDQVWGYKYEGYEHTVNSHINRLRAKIEDDPAEPRYILTVWGVGYKFAEAD